MTTKTYLPAAVDTAPTTPAEALACARAVIEEEGRWAKDAWFRHHNPEHTEYRDNPYCNGWETCAAGALMLVTVGLTSDRKGVCGDEDCSVCNTEWQMYGVTDAGTPEARLYLDSLRYLADEAQERTGDLDRWNIVPRFNDALLTTRDDVIAMFRDAEAKALADAPEAVPA